LNILTPNINLGILKNERLETTLFVSQTEETIIENFIFEEQNCNKNEFYNLEIKHTKLNNCELIDDRFEKCFFTDIVFENCDLSNSYFTDCNFTRCSFINCKLVGSNIIETILCDITLKNSNCSYINFSEVVFRAVLLKENNLSNSIINSCKIETIKFDNCIFINSQIHHTNLKGVDFSTSDITGIGISPQELKGAIVNSVQALDLSKLLGIIIV